MFWGGLGCFHGPSVRIISVQKVADRDTDKTSTDKTSNGQMINVTKNDKSNHLKKKIDKHRQISTHLI